MASNKPPQYWERVLQALVYWIAYKNQHFSKHLLTEGAIIGELTQQLSAKTDAKQDIECEVMYKHFIDSKNDTTRTDIIIGNKPLRLPTNKKSNINTQNVTDIVEVKRYEHNIKNIYKDLEKLAELKETSNKLRLFLIVIGQKKLPEELFTKYHNVRRKNIYNGTTKLKAHPRMGKKAYGSKRKSENGVFAVLIEVL